MCDYDADDHDGRGVCATGMHEAERRRDMVLRQKGEFTDFVDTDIDDMEYDFRVSSC